MSGDWQNADGDDRVDYGHEDNNDGGDSDIPDDATLDVEFRFTHPAPTVHTPTLIA